jgi:hypothetical protein
MKGLDKHWDKNTIIRHAEQFDWKLKISRYEEIYQTIIGAGQSISDNFQDIGNPKVSGHR